jgi:hypothetical protein
MLTCAGLVRESEALRAHLAVQTYWRYWYKSACFTGTKVQLLTQKALLGEGATRAPEDESRRGRLPFTGTQVQLLTQKALLGEVAARAPEDESRRGRLPELLSARPAPAGAYADVC